MIVPLETSSSRCSLVFITLTTFSKQQQQQQQQQQIS